MNDHQIKKIYHTLIGVMSDGYKVPNIENLFADGSYCSSCYAEMLNAYERLCNRLGVIDEDEDVETVIDSLLCIEREVSIQMFRYGMKYGAKELE